MTQKQTSDDLRLSLVLVATLFIVISYALWTTLLLHEYVGSITEGQIRYAQRFRKLEYTVVSVAQKDSSEEIESLHASAPKEVPIPIQATLVDVALEPVQEPMKEEKIEVTESNKEPTKLDNWELSEQYSLHIPSINVRAPVLLPSQIYWSNQEWDLLEEQMQVGLNAGTVAYPHSVLPGGSGSIIVAGHSSPPDERATESAYANVFARVPELVEGDTITVRSNGKNVDYQVESTQVVHPSNTSILKQDSDESTLKLITCYPVGTTRDRWVVTAKQVESVAL